ncbi:MAG: chalcone isomerase family protein [Polyangiaceae bacterium]
MNITRRSILGVLALAPLLSVTDAFALDRAGDGYYHTGDGIRVKHITIIGDVRVYSISHMMRDLPPAKSKQAVIDMDTNKRLTWKMLRDVGEQKIQDALREGFQMNGYNDAAKINQAVGVFNKELVENTYVTITYESDKKATTFAVAGGASTTIQGIDFMKATWRVWFGKIDQPSLSDQLISKI